MKQRRSHTSVQIMSSEKREEPPSKKRRTVKIIARNDVTCEMLRITHPDNVGHGLWRPLDDRYEVLIDEASSELSTAQDEQNAEIATLAYMDIKIEFRKHNGVIECTAIDGGAEVSDFKVGEESMDQYLNTHPSALCAARSVYGNMISFVVPR